MSVWLCIPSRRPPSEADAVLKLWHDQGYKIALYCDVGQPLPTEADFIEVAESYPGYGAAANYLVVRYVMATHADAEWFVIAGDDVEPDLAKTAEEIAAELVPVFAGRVVPDRSELPEEWQRSGTLGVMQPTGDRWGEDALSRLRWPDAPAYIDRVCGSAWYGREYCRRMYGGRGPLCEEYRHMFVDEEAQEVAKKMGVLWQRRDLTQKHRHWMREPGTAAPEFLREVSGQKHWLESKALFERRKAAGFPGHAPIP